MSYTLYSHFEIFVCVIIDIENILSEIDLLLQSWSTNKKVSKQPCMFGPSQCPHIYRLPPFCLQRILSHTPSLSLHWFPSSRGPSQSEPSGSSSSSLEY